MNENIVSDISQNIESENEERVPCTPFEQPKVQENTPMVSSIEKGRTQWTISDTIVLIEAKHNEKDTLSNGGPMKKATSANENWKIVEEYYSHHGVF